MKIGLSLIGITRELGGNFQYALDVFDALASRADTHDIVVFFDNDALRAEPGLQHPGITWTRVERPASGPATRLRSLLRVASGWGLGFLRPLALGNYRVLDDSGCQVIVHPFWGSAVHLTRAPAIAAIHDCAPKESPDWLPFGVRVQLNMLIQAIVRRARVLLVDSEHGGKLVMKYYGATPGQIRVLPFRPPKYLREAPSSSVDVRAKYGLPEAYFFLPGRFGTYKNTERVIEALGLLNAEGPRHHLVLVGIRATETAEAEAVTRKFGVEDSVRVLGFVPDEDMPGFYRNATALVFPTLLGPTSIPVYEALVTGCPVIAPNISGYPGLVGDAALVVNPESTREIADAMRRLADSPDLRAELSARGLERIRELNKVDYADALFDLCAGLAANSDGKA